MSKVIGSCKAGARGSVLVSSDENQQASKARHVKQFSGPDCSWSWVIAVACSFLNFFTLAMLRSGSVIFLRTLDYYDVSRTDASWPLSLISSICNLSGILTGYGVRRFGPRRIAIAGSMISCTSIMACYFATDITKLIIFCGIAHGFGLGLILPAVNFCLNVWFDKKKVTASGLIYTGNALGSFVFPTTFGYLVDHVGFRGCHLIMGALMAHSVTCALLIRMPPWLNKDATQKPTPLKRTGTVDRFTVDHPLVRSGNYMKRSVSQHSFENHEHRQDEDGFQRFHDAMRHHTVDRVEEETEVDDDGTEHDCKKQGGDRRIKIRMGDDPEANSRNVDDQPVKPPQTRRSRGESMRSASVTTAFTFGGNTRLSISSGLARQRLRRRSSAISTTLSLFGPHIVTGGSADVDFEEDTQTKVSPLIILVGISYVIFINSNTCFQTIMLDYAVDKGVNRHSGIYILPGFALMDVAGRLSVGFMSDSGMISRPTMIGISFALFGICLNLLPLVSGFWGVFFCSSVIGFAIGTSMVVIAVLVGDYAGKISNVPVMLGLMSFSTGITGLGRPQLIGFFRDTLGYYDGLLHLMGGSLLAVGVAWSIVSMLERLSEHFTTETQSNRRT